MPSPNPNQEANFYKRFHRYYTYIEPLVADPVIRSYFSVVASLILVSLFVVFALSPTVSTILGLVKKIDDQKNTIAAMDRKIDDLVTAQIAYSSFEPQLNALLVALPEKSTPETAVDSLYNAASSSAVTITALEFGDIPISSISGAQSKLLEKALTVSGRNETGAISLTIAAEGGSGQIEEFLARLEQMPRIIKITNLSFGSKNGAVTASGKAYFLPRLSLEMVSP